ncbi:hypothetical protein [Sodalis sp. dw_96]|uniref:hypothetical protein n=1 Tax=Sodalis sp. dw_96 TaxID=2719794 RepID=UPI001BD48D2E|nr:hypothetical protein [Sodalis sp. dw_96]
MFGIYPDDAPIELEGEPIVPATIIIDGFQESVRLPLTYWSIRDYKKSWLKSLEEGLRAKNHAALAVSMYEPGKTNFIFVWVIFFEGKKAFLRNKILFLEQYPNFASEKINQFIEKRTIYNEDGMKISEWSTDLKSILDFYSSLKKDCLSD